MQPSEEHRKQLIRALQGGVEFVPRPYEVVASSLGLGEAEVIAGIQELQESGVLREISAVLEGSALGHESALVAGSVPEAQLERAVKAVNQHPTVSHNYLRNHRYNLWFTVSVPPSMDLDRTLELLADEAGAESFQPLRRTHIFKIGVNFDPDSLKNATRAVRVSDTPRVVVSRRDEGLFRALQTPLPAVPRPFDELAKIAGVETDELLDFAKGHLGGAIRRYVGTLRHRKLGVKENGMVVWEVEDDGIEAAGLQLAQAPEVSHCYARNAVPGFPYKLYSMVHGPTQESCRELAAELSQKTGLADYAVLFSIKEFKKQRLRYFLPELDEWWESRVGARQDENPNRTSATQV